MTEAGLAEHMRSSKCGVTVRAEATRLSQQINSTEAVTEDVDQSSMIDKPVKQCNYRRCDHCGKEFRAQRESNLNSNYKRHLKNCPVLKAQPVDNFKDIPVPGMSELDSLKGKAEAKAKSPPPLSPEVKTAPSQLSKVRAEKENVGREQVLAYLDVLVNTSSVDAALEQFSLLKSSQDPPAVEAVTCIEVYDVLLRGFSRRSDFQKIQELWKEAVLTEKLKPSLNSYISALSSFVDSDRNNHMIKVVFQQIFRDFESAGFNVQQAVAEGHFIFDDKKRFLKVMQKFLDSSVSQRSNISRPQDLPSLVAGLYKKDTSSAKLVSQVESISESLNFDSLMKQQLEMEAGQVVSIPSINHSGEDSSQQLVSTFTTLLEREWREKVTAEVEQSRVSRLLGRDQGRQLNFRQFLCCVHADKITDIIINKATFILNSDRFSEPTTYLATDLGRELMAAYHRSLKTDKKSVNDFLAGLANYHAWYAGPGSEGAVFHREALLQAGAGELALHSVKLNWPPSIINKVGTEMLRIMLKAVNFKKDPYNNPIAQDQVLKGDADRGFRLEQLKPDRKPDKTDDAFFKIFRKRKGLMDVEELKPHPALSAVFDLRVQAVLRFPATEIPMVCPPIPWLSTATGGYMIRPTKLIKYPDIGFTEHEDLIAALPPDRLNPVLDSLNQLSSVPWKVNKDILQLACRLFLANDQKDSEDYVALMNKLELTMNPERLPEPRPLSEDMEQKISNGVQLDIEEKRLFREHHKSRSLCLKERSEMHSLWCTELYRLSLASHFQARNMLSSSCFL